MLALLTGRILLLILSRMSVSGMTRLQVQSGSFSATCQPGKRIKRRENRDMRKRRKVGQWSRKGPIRPRKNTRESTLLHQFSGEHYAAVENKRIHVHAN